MDLYYEISGNQIDGARDYQEDAFLTTYLDDIDGKPKASALVIMADGMGGHAAGNIASNLVVSTFNKSFTGEFGKRDVATILRSCLDSANNALKESISETPALDGMGCTMVTAAVTQGKVWWVSVGDSHLYLIRDRELDKRNEDHSYGGYLDRMKAQGMDIEPEPGLSRNMLMSAMTGDEIAEIDCPDQPLELKPGDRLVIASDGLDTLSEGSILQFSAWASSSKECVDALLKAVEDANKPRQDNTTVIVVDVLEREAAAAPPPPAPPPQQERDDMEATQPALKAAEPDAVIPDLTQPDLSTTIIDEEPAAKGRGKGLLLVLVAVVVIAALGAGAWFYLTQMSSPNVVVVDAGGDDVDDDGETDVGTDVGDDGVEDTDMDTGEDDDTDSGTDDVDASGTDTDVTDTTDTGTDTDTDTVDTDTTDTDTSAAPEREFADALSAGGTAPAMVRVPGGKFLMGATGFNANQNELPQHEVVVLPFAISKHEITIAEYLRFATATGRKAPATQGRNQDTYPVVFVSWEDALAYTKWLSEQTGHKYRLPSEAEWEYAARGGAATVYWWGNDLGEDNAHCADCESGLDARSPTKIGRFESNGFGLYDTAGNVQEWVHDCYKNTYHGAPNDGSVWEHGECTYRVTRGGAYDTPGSSLRPSSRSKRRPTTPYDSVGIRIVRDLDI